MPQEINYLENYHLLPDEVREIMDGLDEDSDYPELDAAIEKLKPLGWTFDYYLDAVIFDLKPIEHGE